MSLASSQSQRATDTAGALGGASKAKKQKKEEEAEDEGKSSSKVANLDLRVTPAHAALAGLHGLGLLSYTIT
jgi:hypothetical protein